MTVQDYFQNLGLNYVVLVDNVGAGALELDTITTWCEDNIGPSVYNNQNLWYADFIRVFGTNGRFVRWCSSNSIELNTFGFDYLFVGFLLGDFAKFVELT